MVSKQKLSHARTVIAYAPESVSGGGWKGARQKIRGDRAFSNGETATEYPQADEVGGRGKKGAVTARFPMVAKRRLEEARTVIAYAPGFRVEPFVREYFGGTGNRPVPTTRAK